MTKANTEPIKPNNYKEKIMIDLKCHSPLKTTMTTKLKAQFLTLTMRTCWTKRWLIQIFGWCWISFFPLALTHPSWCQKLRFVTVCYHSSREEEKRISTYVTDLHNYTVNNTV